MAGPSSLGPPSNFILGCDPLYSPERRGGVTPYSEIIVRDEPRTTWTSVRISPLWFQNGVWPPYNKERGHTTLWNHSKRWASLLLNHQLFFSFFDSPPQVIEQSLFLFRGCDSPGYSALWQPWLFGAVTSFSVSTLWHQPCARPASATLTLFLFFFSPEVLDYQHCSLLKGSHTWLIFSNLLSHPFSFPNSIRERCLF